MSLNTNTIPVNGKIMLVRDFQEYYENGRLENLEQVWGYYSQLNAVEKYVIRDYFSENGEIGFREFIKRVVTINPCGTGTTSLVGKMNLIEEINKELETLSKKERRNYLNGSELKFRISKG